MVAASLMVMLLCSVGCKGKLLCPGTKVGDKAPIFKRMVLPLE